MRQSIEVEEGRVCVCTCVEGRGEGSSPRNFETMTQKEKNKRQKIINLIRKISTKDEELQ